MKAHEVAANAATLMTGDRQRTHGDKRVNHENIAALWSAYLTRRLGIVVELNGTDAALLMVQMKVARTLAGVFNEDDFVDMVGYGCIAGELASPVPVERVRGMPFLGGNTP